MSEETHQSIVEFLKNIEFVPREERIIILESKKKEIEIKRQSTININGLIEQRQERFILEKKNSGFSQSDTISVTKMYQTKARNNYLLKILDIQFNKITVLLRYYQRNGLNHKEAADLMRYFICQEANTRRDMIKNDIKAESIINNTVNKQNNRKKQLINRNIVARTKDEETILNLNVESLADDIPESVLLSPKNLEYYSLDLLLVINEQREMKKNDEKSRK